jgi:hypothetical protein
MAPIQDEPGRYVDDLFTTAAPFSGLYTIVSDMSGEIEYASVPEPRSFVLMFLGLVLVSGWHLVMRRSARTP